MGTYWVLDTDYDNWASVYSCTDIAGLIKLEFAWVLGRAPQLTEEQVSCYSLVRLHMRQSNHIIMRHTVLQLTTAYDAYTSRGIDISDIVPTEQIDCAYEKPEDTCADDL